MPANTFDDGAGFRSPRWATSISTVCVRSSTAGPPLGRRALPVAGPCHWPDSGLTSRMTAMASRSRISWPLVTVLRPVHRLFMPLYFRIVLRDAERMPREGPVILAPTPVRNGILFVLSYLTGGRLRYLATHHEFVGIQGWFMRRLGAFPINTAAPRPGPLRHARELVVAGEPLVVFPEGTIFYYRPGEVHPLKPGAAWLALGASEQLGEVPLRIIPIRLYYSHRFLRFRSRIEVMVGNPITVSPYLSYSRKEAIRMITSHLQTSLGDVVNASLDGGIPAADRRAEKRQAKPLASERRLEHGLVAGPRSAVADPRRHGLCPAWNLCWSFTPRSGPPPRGLRWQLVVADPAGLLRRDRCGHSCARDADARGHSRRCSAAAVSIAGSGLCSERRRTSRSQRTRSPTSRITAIPAVLKTQTTSSMCRAFPWCDRSCFTDGWPSACWPTCSTYPSALSSWRRLASGVPS